MYSVVSDKGIDRGMILQTRSGSDEHDIILGPIKKLLLPTESSKAMLGGANNYVVGSLSLFLYAVSTAFSFVKSLSNAGKMVDKIPGASYLSSVPVHIWLLVQWITADLTSGIHKGLSDILMILAGANIFYFGAKSNCTKWLLIPAGVIQISYILFRKNVLDKIIPPAFMVLFNFTTIIVAGLVLVDWLINGGKDCFRTGKGENNSLFYN